MSNNQQSTNRFPAWLHIGSGALLLVSFFLPWVSWKGVKVSGYDLPAGNFFRISESNFKLGNPFPQFDFTFYVFWLVPVLVIVTAFLIVKNKRSSPAAFAAGALALSMVTVYYLFSNTLVDLGVGTSAISMLQPAAYISMLAAMGFILTAFPLQDWLKKGIWLIIGPVLAFTAYKMGEKYVMAETFTQTDELKADYTVNAMDLVREFLLNDTAANNKYREKILVVNGTPTQVDRSADSTTTVQFADSTGSYVAFSFEKEKYELVKEMQAGTPVSLKGSCSGSIYSEILGTTAITFKRATINKK